MSTLEILARLSALSPAERAQIRGRLDALEMHQPSSGVGTAWSVAEDSIRLPWTLEQIVEETRLWPADVVAELVDRILIAKHGGVEVSVDSSWRSEAQRRVAELESGQVQGIPIEETLAKARKLIGR